VQTQAEFSYALGASLGFGDELPPSVSGPADWGRDWFRNIRAYECKGASDPVCVAAADARDGQVRKA
jgi:hypothetical protein